MSTGHAARGGLTARRQWAGVLVAAVVLPALTAILVWLRSDLSLTSILLLYVVVVVAASAAGGILSGLLSALGSFLLANFFLTPPYGTFVVESRDSVIALSVFLVVAAVVSILVDVMARRRAQAARAEAEAGLLGRVVSEPLAGRGAREVLEDLAATFGLSSVELRTDGMTPSVLLRVGDPIMGHGTVTVDAGDGRVVVADGRALFAEDRRLLSSLAHAAARALDTEALAAEAERGRELAEVDRLRSALLAAVSHDLRTPLSAIKAAVTTLRQNIVLSDQDREELLATVEDSTDRLTDLVANLLDLGRLQAGAFTVDVRPVALDEVVGHALIEGHLSDVRNDVPDNLPYALADPGLLQRVVANLVENAHHYGSGRPVEVQASATSSEVSLSVLDHGPGVADADWVRMFEPFHRVDGAATSAHAGLGLAIARGFTQAMAGRIRPAHTPGGGLTMTVTLPRADRSEDDAVGAR